MSERPDTRRAREVRRRHAAELLARPGVVSVGVGLDAHGDAAVVVGVDSAETAEPLALPDAIEGVPVVVRVVGRFEASD